MKSNVSGAIWQDRKRTVFGLPWSFTRYFITDEKVILDIGFLSRTEEEIRLYRITDVTLKRSFCERIFGLGTIHCCSGDKSTPEFDIKHIKNSRATKEMLSDLVEKARNERRVAVREFVDADGIEHED
ncbi:MAG: PH domain-containing protein [Clostridia bacterium]|nr:PH domain-containing protein [Clostridia bacterium]